MEMSKFQLYFQPKVNIQTNCIIGYEILLRIEDPFPRFPKKELEEIIENQKKHASFLMWFESKLIKYFNLFPTIIFSINFTPKQLLYPETQQLLTNIIDFREQVIIELTENEFAYFCPLKYISNEIIEKKLCHSLMLIKEKKYIISLDDVGAGRNSLERVESYLEYIDQIKFSLIKYNSKLIEDETIQLFLRSWNSFAKKNHLELIIEGIENQQTRTFLKTNKIYLQQGYFFGKPCKYIN